MTNDNDVLLGVPEPADLPAGVSYVVPDEERAFDTARSVVEDSLSRVRTQLKELRSQREQINTEIRRLVDEEELLGRMARVRAKGAS